MTTAQAAHTTNSGRLLTAVPPQLAGIALRQAGVLTRRQLWRHDFTDDQIRAAVSARRWQAFGKHVVVLDNAPLTRRQKQWVAVLSPGKLAALAGVTATANFGLSGFEEEQIHVVVAGASRTHWPMWVTVHNSRRLAERDIVRRNGLPTTSLARSVIDAAAWTRNPDGRSRCCAPQFSND